jgi:hypothetical protein
VILAGLEVQINKNMAKKKVKEEIIKEEPIVKQRRTRVTKVKEEPIIETEVVIEPDPIIELQPEPVIVENTWQRIVDMAESLYIALDEEYKISAKNDISSMLILMSSVIKSAKKRL